MQHVDKPIIDWAKIVVEVIASLAILILSNFLIIYFFSFQIWSSAGYIFGHNVRTTFGVLMFVESSFLLALGSLWALGSMDNVRYGKYGKSYGPITREGWEQRRGLTENPNNVIKLSLLTGSFLLIASVFLLLT